MAKRILTAALMMTTLGFLGCGNGTIAEDDSTNIGRDGLTWDEFNSVIYQEPDTGVYIVDGDTPIYGEKNLREFYDNHVAYGDKLCVDTINGADDKWNDTQKMNMTYCVNKTAFGSNYTTVVQAMAAATAEWEAAANVKWQYLSAQDTNCTASNNNVLFDVNPVNANGQYAARSFFPNTARASRNILIDGSAFAAVGNPSYPGISVTGLLRHELGHTIGFRHEHTRPEAGTCFEDNNWRALTPYDQASVMHYPQCNGITSWALALTANDKAGAALLYGAPVGTPAAACAPACSGATPVCDSGTCKCNATSCGAGYTCNASGACVAASPSSTTVENVNNVSVAASANKNYGPYSVAPGTVFDVKMTGTGDADLYVNFGSAPTTSTYACRPYLTGSTESCSLTVPASASSAYIMVRGYSAATFSLVITYTKPNGSTPPPVSGTPKTTSIDGSVTKGQSVSYTAITVMSGTTFTVNMTGTGDPDLYVNFGAPATTSAYACRPWLTGATESCSVKVPTGLTTAYIMVNGYTAGTFHLDVSYTTP